MKQLTREQFKDGVFARDNHRCVACGKTAEETPEGKLDAHHIIERRLWGASLGYFLDNGATVCEEHHLQCEQTVISVERIREMAGITKICIPEHFYDDQIYDKWGNVVMEDGRRLRGELFDDESVQKVLKSGGVLDSFVKYMKYPRTYHLPYSPGMNDDDRQMPNNKTFEGKMVVVTEKMDGENTTMYDDYMHARSVTSGNHESRNWMRAFHASIANDIPAGWRVNVENMYAKHSIKYEDLRSYAYGFFIWDEHNRVLPWDTRLEWFNLLNIEPAPLLYRGVYDPEKIQAAFKNLNHESEGFVVQLDEPFLFSEFKQSVAKYVRANHVQTVKHWMHGQRVEPNELASGLTGYEYLQRF